MEGRHTGASQTTKGLKALTADAPGCGTHDAKDDSCTFHDDAKRSNETGHKKAN